MQNIENNNNSIIINGDNSGVVNFLNQVVDNSEYEIVAKIKDKMLAITTGVYNKKSISRKDYDFFWLYIDLVAGEEPFKTYFVRALRVFLTLEVKVKYLMFKSWYLSYKEQKEIVDVAFDDIFQIISKDDLKVPKEYADFLSNALAQFELGKEICKDYIGLVAKRKNIEPNPNNIKFNEKFYEKKMNYYNKLTTAFEILFTEGYKGSFSQK